MTAEMSPISSKNGSLFGQGKSIRLVLFGHLQNSGDLSMEY